MIGTASRGPKTNTRIGSRMMAAPVPTMPLTVPATKPTMRTRAYVTGARTSRSASGLCADLEVRAPLIPDVRPQPFLGLLDRHAAAAGVVLDLVAAYAGDAEILRLGMGEVVARHRRRGQHGEALGQRHAGVLAGIEQAEQLRLLAVIGAGGIARRGADAAILLADQVLVGERLVGRVAPQRLAHALVQALGERLGQPVGQRLQEDVGIVVMVGLEARQMLLDAVARRHGEAADPVGEATVGATRALLDLLAQEVEPRDLLGAALVLVEHDVVALAPARPEGDHALRRQPLLAHDMLQHLARVAVELPRTFAHHLVLEDGGIVAGQLPGAEARRPVDALDQRVQRVIGEDARARDGGAWG